MKYQFISRIQFLLAPMPLEIINRIWSRFEAENPTLDSHGIAAKVEQHFGIRTLV
jgi:hypothetical protein